MLMINERVKKRYLQEREIKYGALKELEKKGEIDEAELHRHRQRN